MMQPVSRRMVLRGVGSTLALPWLDAMLPRSFGKDSAPANSPLRMAFLMVPNGAHMPEWTPVAEGASFDLPPILQPLQNVRGDISVLSGLTQAQAFALGDGGGDHARSAAAFLTGIHPRKTHGANIHCGVSVDQLAANAIGRQTRLASLELGCEPGLTSGNCDSGYSCAYQSNISWRNATTPCAKEVNPRLVFERLFSSGSPQAKHESREKRLLYRQSILDLVNDDAQRLRGKLGGTDQQKLDEYLTGVRELELRLQLVESKDVKPPADFKQPAGVPGEYREHLRLMCDLIVLAFQGDLTRVTTFMLANEGSNRNYQMVGVSEAHHELSHHGGSKEKQEKIAKINHFHMEQFAYLLERLKKIKEGERSLLHHSMIMYGSGIGDGDRHNHDDLPIVLAGQAGGTITSGRHVKYANRTPLNNLYLAMLERFGVQGESLGDGTEALKNLKA
ncbi:MAG: DUF1552 domain-containing protein [Planctomycetes bacterium]|nr:DUF1552 domain-containing protein [Planctomycetota bacterium]